MLDYREVFLLLRRRGSAGLNRFDFLNDRLIIVVFEGSNELGLSLGLLLALSIHIQPHPLRSLPPVGVELNLLQLSSVRHDRSSPLYLRRRQPSIEVQTAAIPAGPLARCPYRTADLLLERIDGPDLAIGVLDDRGVLSARYLVVQLFEQRLEVFHDLSQDVHVCADVALELCNFLV